GLPERRLRKNQRAAQTQKTLYPRPLNVPSTVIVLRIHNMLRTVLLDGRHKPPLRCVRILARMAQARVTDDKKTLRAYRAHLSGVGHTLCARPVFRLHCRTTQIPVMQSPQRKSDFDEPAIQPSLRNKQFEESALADLEEIFAGRGDFGFGIRDALAVQ